MVRCLLPSLVLGTIAEESLLMQFEKSSGLNVEHGSMRTMQQTAQGVADAYKTLLESIVKSDPKADPRENSNHIPSDDILSKVREQFTGLEDELKHQQSTNQGIMDDHERFVKQCNTNREDAFKLPENGVIALKKAMEAARKTHKTCRDEEDDLIDTMENDCDAFQGMPRCPMNDQDETSTAAAARDQNWFAELDTNSNYKDKENRATTLKQVINQATLCRAGVIAVSGKAETCDDNQCAFQSAFEKYENKLWDTCEKLDTCYAQAVHNKDYAQQKIQELEAEQKLLWNMVQRVHCYLDLLKNKEFDQDAIDTCNDLDKTNFGTRREGETTGTEANLNINYAASEAKSACEENGDNAPEDGGAVGDDEYPLIQDDYSTDASSRYKPGVAAWKIGEYDNEGLIDHGKINEPVIDACSPTTLLQATA